MAAYAVRTLDEIPSIDDEGVDWKPLQHFFGLTAFGVNVYRRVRFTVAGEELPCGKGTVIAVKDPAVRRAAGAETADAAVLAIGNRQAERFESTWRPHHFAGVPTVDD